MINYIWALILNNTVINVILATQDFIVNIVDGVTYDTAVAFDVNGQYPSPGQTYLGNNQFQNQPVTFNPSLSNATPIVSTLPTQGLTIPINIAVGISPLPPQPAPISKLA